MEQTRSTHPTISHTQSDCGRAPLNTWSYISRYASGRNGQKHKRLERERHDGRSMKHFDLARTGKRLPLILPKAFSKHVLNLVSEGANHEKH